MTASGAAHAFMTIGEVLAQLRTEFPDVTISKIRFLESEGLINPERSPSRYRKFSRDDVSRLRYVLAAQRDRYLPLRVIKDHLDALDRGLELTDEPGAAPRPRAVVWANELPTARDFAPDTRTVRLTRSELARSAGLDEHQLVQLEQFGLISARSGHFDETALAIAQAVAELARFGLEARHLRGSRAAADREIGLVEQVVTPLLRQRGDDARGRAAEAASELAALSVRLHAALVKAGLRDVLGR